MGRGEEAERGDFWSSRSFLQGAGDAWGLSWAKGKRRSTATSRQWQNLRW